MTLVLLLKMEELKNHQSSLDVDQLRSLSREQALALATVCEKAGRFKDMLVIMLAFVSTCPIPTKLESEERLMLSIAYNKLVMPLRVAIKNVSESLSSDKCDEIRSVLETYRETLIKELESHCSEFIELVQRIVLFESAFQDAEAIIWAYKTIGDHHRYEAELFLPSKESSKDLADTAFNRGLSEAQTRLTPTSPLRLSLALNYAVFCYEILKDEEKARSIAQEALDTAEAEITSLKVPHSSLPDTDALLRLIQKTLVSWKKT